jgi:hypothetical protein
LRFGRVARSVEVDAVQAIQVEGDMTVEDIVDVDHRSHVNTPP